MSNDTLNPYVVLDATRAVPDPAVWLKTIMKDDWNGKNTDGAIPDVELGEFTRQIDFRGRDWIIVVPISENEEPVTVGYQFTNISYTYSLMFYTSENRSHFIKFVEEARRIALSHRRDSFQSGETPEVSGRQWLKWGIRSTPSRTGSGMWMKTVDIEIRWRYRAI